MERLPETYRNEACTYKKIRSDSKILSKLQATRKATQLPSSLRYRESIESKLSRINIFKELAGNYQK